MSAEPIVLMVTQSPLPIRSRSAAKSFSWEGQVAVAATETHHVHVWSCSRLCVVLLVHMFVLCVHKCPQVPPVLGGIGSPGSGRFRVAWG